jgi:regulator of sigma E protease
MGILTFVIVLGILIFVHEFGHFYFAKRAGVGVEKFSIGFGPKIASFTRGETEYRIGIIPLGGYVKMVGDNPDEQKGESNKEFLSRPVRDRLPIVAAGPIVNLIVAALLMPLVYMIGVQVPAFINDEAVVGFVTPDSPAEKAGIQPGDHVVSINDAKIDNWEALLNNTIAEPDQEIRVGLVRGGTKMTLPVRLGTDESGAATFGVQPAAPTIVGLVSPDSAAAEAGMQPNDEIVALNDTPIQHWSVMADFIQKHGAKPLTVTIKRAGETQTLTITPRKDEASDRVLLGISRDEPLETVQYGFVGAVQEGLKRTVQMTTQTFQILGKLITGQLSVKTLGGPIRIAQATSAAAESGIADVLTLMAFLSLQLGIMNLLPLPILDGGHILFMGIEAIRRRPLSRKALEISNQVSFVLLITLMVVVTKNDIMHAWGAPLQKFFEGVKNLF